MNSQDRGSRDGILAIVLAYAALAAAWILNTILPGVSESVIESRLMVAMAAALGVLLFVYK